MTDGVEQRGSMYADDDADLDIELTPVEPASPEGPPTPRDGLTDMPGPAAPVPGVENGAAALSIEAEDLADIPEDPVVGPLPTVVPAGISTYKATVGAVPADIWTGGKGKPGLVGAGLISSLMAQMLAAGAIGGLVAWAVVEPGIRASELHPSLGRPTPAEQLVSVVQFGGVLGAFVGLTLGAVEGFVIAAWSRAATGGILGLLIGGAGGAAGGLVGQLTYGAILGGGDPEATLSFVARAIAARALGWALIGACVGLGPGLMIMAPRKIVNGLLGGAAGGFIGGLLFDPIGFVFQAVGEVVGTPSRLMGIVVTGMCAGLGVGLVEEMRKEAWLLVIGGPLAGKQFILYRHLTWVGSAPGMDIPLVKDRQMAPKQCVLEAGGRSHTLRHLGGPRTLVNGQPVATQRLVDGDVIQVGQTVLQYRTRPVAAGPEMASMSRRM